MCNTRLARITLIVAGIFVLASAARATTFIPMDEGTMMRTAVAVVVGTVTGIESAAPDPDGPIYTYVHIQPEHVIKGAVGTGPLVLREPGGTAGDRREWVFGAPEFWVGERDLLFLSVNADGSLQTHSLSMGKFTLSVNSTGSTVAVRDFGYGATVYMPSSGQMMDAQPEQHQYIPMRKRLRALARLERHSRKPPAFTTQPSELGSSPTEVQENFVFLGSPSRWFEPDSGLAVNYLIDSTGDAKLGFATSRAAVDSAFAAWTNVPTSSLILADGGTTSPTAFAGCGTNRIIFNDPNSEVTNPSNCAGVLAMGGYCTGGGTTVVNGTTFNRIVVGKVTFNNGWTNCNVWTQCNMAEVATHELGHTIGLGHSADQTATMAAVAHFDGRCAGLGADDIAAVNFIYPQSGTPAATAVAVPTRTPTPFVGGVPTRTPTRAPTRTPTRTPTKTPTRPPVATRTPTRPPATRTPTPRGATPVPTRCFFGMCG